MGYVSTPDAFKNSLLDVVNGTEWQVGAFIWRAWRKGNMVHIIVINTTTFNSAFYHIPEHIPHMPAEWDRLGWGFGPLGTVYQQFDWWEQVPKKFCK